MKFLIVAIASIVVSAASLVFVRATDAQVTISPQDVEQWFANSQTFRLKVRTPGDTAFSKDTSGYTLFIGASSTSG